jgi:hypothetical protein
LGNELTGWLSEVLEQWSAIRRQFPFGNDFFDSTNHYGLQIGPGHVGHWQKMLLNRISYFIRPATLQVLVAEIGQRYSVFHNAKAALI